MPDEETLELFGEIHDLTPEAQLAFVDVVLRGTGSALADLAQHAEDELATHMLSIGLMVLSGGAALERATDSLELPEADHAAVNAVLDRVKALIIRQVPA